MGSTPHYDIIVFHGGCLDGFGAAYALWQKFGETVQYYAATYDDEIPEDWNAKSLLFVDFCFKRPVMEAILNRGNHILVLDHHKSAAEDMAPLVEKLAADPTRPVDFAVHFDMNKSGARLAWDWANPDAFYVPRLIRVIEENDLWRFDFEDCRPLFSYLESLPMDFLTWKGAQLGMEDLTNRNAMIYAGETLIRSANREREKLFKKQIPMTICGHKVFAINAPYWHASELGNKLARVEGVPFGATYFDDAHGRKFSLRSIDGKVDVSEVAVMLGGGGHRNASGFSAPHGWTGDPIDVSTGGL